MINEDEKKCKETKISALINIKTVKLENVQ